MAVAAKEQIVEMSEGTITDDGLRKWNKRIGASL